MDKAVFDSATRFLVPEIHPLLVSLLNEANLYVAETHASQLGVHLLEGRFCFAARIFNHLCLLALIQMLHL